jgi:hypothetical protein
MDFIAGCYGCSSPADSRLFQRLYSRPAYATGRIYFKTAPRRVCARTTAAQILISLSLFSRRHYDRPAKSGRNVCLFRGFWSNVYPRAFRHLVRHSISTPKEKMKDPLLSALQNQVSGGATGHLARIQTTFVEVIIEEVTHRIIFRGKHEFSAKRGEFSSLEILDQHPLLLDYREPLASLYFGASPAAPEAFLTKLQTANEVLFQGWRDVSRYLNPLMPPNKLIQTARGKLLTGPLSFLLQAQSLAETHQMKPSLQTGKTASTQAQILLLDRQYIIAEQFFAEPNGTLILANEES